ncbi:hypothetical protein ILUMI_18374 [Ignelater luminosus]|uniref:DUF4371 domain-containing protein n=1 Tax=Ignelater luminosus TaxID=2038154 RepID=A0A8K0CI54_IGNLU|nr:hypothetical protein ILUMI_18374 [Ignelater luminosus]
MNNKNLDFSNLACENEGCIIELLLEKPFSRYAITAKREIINIVRPTPDLSSQLTTEIKVKNKATKRHFQISYYDKNKWLCACVKLNKMFCWSCLLFANNNSIWDSAGYNNLSNFFNAASKHEKSQSHISSFLSFKMFGRVRIDLALDEQKRIDIVEHNKKVTKNREILKRFIDVVCFLGTQELAFRAHDERKDITNRGNYIELIKLLSLYDEKLATHLQESSVFSGISNHIQNDLIESVASIMMDSIKAEIKECMFVAILLDETSDVSNHSQLSTMVRYVTKSGYVCGRFLGFTDVSADRSATALSKHVIETIQQLCCGDKFIAQAYDGAAVMSGELNGTQAKVKEVYPKAFFIHCCAHVLNFYSFAISNHIKECKIFFSTITGISSFLSHSTKRSNALESIIKLKIPHAAPTRWIYNSRLVNTVYHHREQLIEFFTSIQENPQNWDKDTIVLAGGFLTFLKDFNSVFLLLMLASNSLF